MASAVNAKESSPVHFHIRWNSTGELDCFRFSSRYEAEESAKLWARQNEIHSIEAFDDSCSKCAELLAKTSKPAKQ